MKLTEITEEQLKFDDGTIIEFHHEQDCCENVFADFKSLSDQELIGKEFNSLDIEGVKDSGFKLNGHFVPCYNKQNGYYSSDLELVINHPDESKTTKDISKFVADKIC